MQKIHSATELREAIVQLEIQQADEARMVKEQFHMAFESARPINLIKSMFQQSDQSQSSGNNLLSTSVGLTAGYLSKLLFQGTTRNPIKKLLGTAIMFGITDVVAKKPGVITSIGKGILKMIISKLADKAEAKKNRSEKPLP